MAKAKPAQPMIYPVPFEAEHARQIRLTAAEAPHFRGFTLADLKLLEGPRNITIMADGVPILLMGTWDLWANRAYVWWFIGEDATAERYGEMQDHVKAWVDGLPHRRLEMAADIDHLPGHQWVRSLGFGLEAKRARAFFPNGRDVSLYALIKEVTQNG